MSDNQTILIVDDDEQVRRSMELLFRRSPYSVRIFDSAKELLNHPLDSSIVCILADLLMPEMNGIELSRELTSRQINIPFVLMTGNSDDPAAQANPGSKIWIIEKPFRFAQLMAKVKEAIDWHQSIDQHTSDQAQQEPNTHPSDGPQDFEFVRLFSGLASVGLPPSSAVCDI